MELFVYEGDNRDLIGVVSLYSSFRAVWRFDEPGEFTLRIPLSGIKGLRAFEPGLWLWPQGAREIFIVETVVLSDAGEREQAELTGRTASALLARRVIPDTTIGNGTHGQLIAGLIESVFSRPARAFPGLAIDVDAALGGVIQYHPRAGPLLDAVEELCQGAALGFETLFDPVGKGLTLRVYAARDLSVTGQGLSVVFDPGYENIADYEFTDSIEGTANIAYVVTGTDETTGIATKVCVARRTTTRTGMLQPMRRLDTSGSRRWLSMRGATPPAATARIMAARPPHTRRISLKAFQALAESRPLPHP
ncbi:MAG: siphovirus ReqiPepy6 Gp37-like family protein [Oscillospiraceae bacterium]|jgi:hypothetical protein|nr:siphovirus ReqiPepy6 Gp37-like family protein [Oscillospiraceae bacterium]